MEALGIVGPYIGGSLVNIFKLFHPFGGVVDIIVVEQKDGSYKSSPWYVRFGKFLGVLKAKEKIVNININGIDLDFNMYLDHNGEAYFLHESNANESESMVSPSSGDVSNENRKIRAFIPTSEQLAILQLKEGKNMVTFISSTRMLGRQQVDARIYLWRWDTRIVISDVDGTITRSDVLGQVMPWVGVDWTQTGVTHLFTAIKENGYQLLFLSARAISQAYLTRQFLFNIKQDGKSLPDGPVVISPNGVVPSLYREVVRRAPHEFKIACLEDVKALFPSDINPFYAGFGNRDTDELSYLKVGIPLGKIFIVNPKGEIVMNTHHDEKSYTSLHLRVNGVFPPTSTLEQEESNSWNFWKLPPPDLLDWTRIVV